MRLALVPTFVSNTPCNGQSGSWLPGCAALLPTLSMRGQHSLHVHWVKAMRVDVTLYGSARVVIGQPLVEVSFDSSTATLGQVLQQLIVAYPRARPYLLDEAGRLPSFMRVLINTVRPDPDATLATVLHDKDRVALLVAVAGGTSRDE
jgi:molybdopterin converting factor small subunit